MLLFGNIYKTTASKELHLSTASDTRAVYAKVYNFLERQIISLTI